MHQSKDGANRIEALGTGTHRRRHEPSRDARGANGKATSQVADGGLLRSRGELAWTEAFALAPPLAAANPRPPDRYGAKREDPNQSLR